MHTDTEITRGLRQRLHEKEADASNTSRLLNQLQRECQTLRNAIRLMSPPTTNPIFAQPVQAIAPTDLAPQLRMLLLISGTDGRAMFTTTTTTTASALNRAAKTLGDNDPKRTIWLSMASTSALNSMANLLRAWQRREGEETDTSGVFTSLAWDRAASFVAFTGKRGGVSAIEWGEALPIDDRTYTGIVHGEHYTDIHDELLDAFLGNTTPPVVPSATALAMRSDLANLIGKFKKDDAE